MLIVGVSVIISDLAMSKKNTSIAVAKKTVVKLRVLASTGKLMATS